MPSRALEASLENQILDRLTSLTNNVRLDLVDENLLTQFEYAQLCRKTKSVTPNVRKYTLLALLELNYTRDLQSAERLFKQGIASAGGDVPSWTLFVAFLAARGFPSKATEYAFLALEHIQSPEVIHNALLHAYSILDVKMMARCLDICAELRYINSEVQPEWLEESANLLDEINEFMKVNQLDLTQASHILNTVQDAISNQGYVIKGHFSNDNLGQDDWLVSFTISENDMDKIGEINMQIADIFAENDWLDSKVAVLVMPHGA